MDQVAAAVTHLERQGSDSAGGVAAVEALSSALSCGVPLSGELSARAFAALERCTAPTALALLESADASAVFFGLQTLQAGLGGRRAAAAVPDPAGRAAVRTAVVAFACRTPHAPLPPHLATKVGVVLSLLVKSDYPEHWPTAFVDVFALLQRGEALVDVVLRCLTAVDDEVVVYRDDRKADEVAHNTLIKDTLRSTSGSADVCGALLWVVETHRGGAATATGAALAARALEVFRRYIGWLDPAHVYCERCLALLFGGLSSEGLLGGAAGCLYELVNKGMDEEAKVAVLAGPLARLFDGLERIPLHREGLAGAEQVRALFPCSLFCGVFAALPLPLSLRRLLTPSRPRPSPGGRARRRRLRAAAQLLRHVRRRRAEAGRPGGRGAGRDGGRAPGPGGAAGVLGVRARRY